MHGNIYGGNSTKPGVVEYISPYLGEDTAMQLCYGPRKAIVPMNNNVRYTMWSLWKHYVRESGGSNGQLFIEYHPGLYLLLDTPDKVEMALEMVCRYHDHIRPTIDDDIWLDSLGKMFVRCTLPNGSMHAAGDEGGGGGDGDCVETTETPFDGEVVGDEEDRGGASGPSPCSANFPPPLKTCGSNTKAT